jgi:hypothetical protein
VHHTREQKRNETRLQVPVFISSGDFIDRQLQQLTEALPFSRSTNVNRFDIRLIRRACSQYPHPKTVGSSISLSLVILSRFLKLRCSLPFHASQSSHRTPVKRTSGENQTKHTLSCICWWIPRRKRSSANALSPHRSQ